MINRNRIYRRRNSQNRNTPLDYSGGVSYPEYVGAITTPQDDYYYTSADNYDYDYTGGYGLESDSDYSLDYQPDLQNMPTPREPVENEPSGMSGILRAIANLGTGAFSSFANATTANLGYYLAALGNELDRTSQKKDDPIYNWANNPEDGELKKRLEAYISQFPADKDSPAANFLLDLEAGLKKRAGAFYDQLPDTIEAETPFTAGAKTMLDVNAWVKDKEDDALQYINGAEQTEWDRIWHGGGTGFGYALSNIPVELTKFIPYAGPAIAAGLKLGMEARSEAWDFLTEKYKEDPSRYKDAVKVANILFATNAPTDLATDALIDFGMGRIPGKGLLKKSFKALGKEILQENAQEAYQRAYSTAAERLYQSNDISSENYKKILAEEVAKIPDHIREQAWEVSMSTGITTSLMGALGLGRHGSNPAFKKGGIFTKAGRQEIAGNSLREDMELRADIYGGEAYTENQDLLNILDAPDANRNRLQQSHDNLAQRRAELQDSINRLYSSIGEDADTDIEAMSRIADLERELQGIERKVGGMDRDLIRWDLHDQAKNSGKITSTPVQDDAMDFFADMQDNTNPNDTETNEQAIPPIAVVDTNIPRDEFVDDETTEFDNPAGIHIVTSRPNLIPDTGTNDIQTQARSIAEALGIIQTNDSQSGTGDIEIVDDEADDYLEPTGTESYYQTATADGNHGANDNEQDLGTLVFSTNSKDYEFNIFSTIHKAASKVLSFADQRMRRFAGRFIEIRNKRGQVIATFNPNYGEKGFSFNFDVARKHSERWRSAFQRNFMANLGTYLQNGGFVDNDGNLLADGSEDFRKRWQARIAQGADGRNAFYDDTVHNEDLDTPVAGTLNVNYQNGEGVGVTRELDVKPGEFGAGNPQQRAFYGRYLDIVDKTTGKLVARYSPYTGTIKFVKGGDTDYAKGAILTQLKRQAKSLMANAGFLDADGRLISDGNEEYRARVSAGTGQAVNPAFSGNTLQNIQQLAQQGSQSAQQTALGANQQQAADMQQAATQQATMPTADTQGNQQLGQQSAQLNQQAAQAQQGTQAQQNAQAEAVLGALGQNETHSQRAANAQANAQANTQTNAAQQTATQANATQNTGEKVIYIDDDGQYHVLTLRTGEFGDEHAAEKQYFGRYVEAVDENGNVVARYSPYTGILQTAKNLSHEKADAIKRGLIGDYQFNGTRRLANLGYFDEYGRLKDDGNDEFRRQYRARLDTTPKGARVHPNNLRQGKVRADTRTAAQKAADNVEQRRARKRVENNIAEKLINSIMGLKDAEIKRTDEQTKAAYEFILDKDGKREKVGLPLKARYLYDIWRTNRKDKSAIKRERKQLLANAKAVSKLAAAGLQGMAHGYGMSVEDLYNAMGFNVVYDTFVAANNENGYTDIIKPGQKIGVDENGNDILSDTAQIVIHINPLTNVSTSIHEFGHMFLDEMKRLSLVDDLPQEFRNTWLGLTKWLGISDLDFSDRQNWTDEQEARYVNAQEKFATGLERYMGEGKSPIKQFKRIFKKFKTWMAHVYNALKNIRYAGKDGRFHDVEIAPQVREFYDSLFKDVPYVPSESNKQARIELSRDANHSWDSSEYHQTAGRQGKSTDTDTTQTSRQGAISMTERIGRSDDSFVTQEDIERYEQISLYGSNRIIVNNNLTLKYVGKNGDYNSYAWGLHFTTDPSWAVRQRLAGTDTIRHNVRVHDADGNEFFYDADNNNGWSINGEPETRDVETNEWRDVMYRLTGKMIRTRNAKLSDVKDELKNEYRRQLKATIALEKKSAGFVPNEPQYMKDSSSTVRGMLGIDKAEKRLSYGGKKVKFSSDAIRRMLRILDGINDFKMDGERTWDSGNVYFADIPENDSLLDIDAPTLDKQPEKVRKGIEKVINSLTKWKVDGRLIDRVRNSSSGEEFIENLKDALRPLTDAKRIKSKRFGVLNRADMAASLVLNQAGIPGLRHKNKLRRENKKGRWRSYYTHDFTIWNTDMVKLLGISDDSDERAKQHFNDTVRARDERKAGSPETYNQVIGARGARAIDKADGNSNMSSSLELAQKLMARGFKARTIKRNTGWELGIDGEWRFEIPDGSLSNPDGKSSLTLKEFYRNPKLYKAYPKLGDIKVAFDIENG